jgi:hypothetical protein
MKEKGEIIEINKDNKSFKTDSENKKLNSYRRTFINYFSLGYDARVGFGFEKSRSGNRCINKCIYFWEGCKKNCCRKTIPLNSFFDSFLTVEETEDLEIKNFIEDVRNSKKENLVDNIIAPVPSNKKLTDPDIIFDNLIKKKSKIFFRSKSTLAESSDKKCKIFALIFR